MTENDPEWQRLKLQIEQTVELTPSKLTLGGQDLTWLRVSNPDVLLETAVSKDDTPAVEIDPFWAATWRAAQGLDRFLAKLDIRGTRVLELGCGSGQAGIGAAIRGADVVLTDAVELALDVALLNGWSVRDKFRCQKLIWCQQQLDAPKFPIVIGSDLVYDPSHFFQLLQAAREHLLPGGRLLLSEPHRHTGDKFAVFVRESGWDTIEHDVDLNDGGEKIRIFECTIDSNSD